MGLPESVLSDILVFILLLFRSILRVFFAPFLPIRSVHPHVPSLAYYTLHTWNTVHIECRLPNQLLKPPDASMSRRSDAVHTYSQHIQQTSRTTKR